MAGTILQTVLPKPIRGWTDSKILVVEDDSRMCESLRYLLVYQGFDVHTCENLAGALNALLTIRYDLVLLDLQLEEESEKLREALTQVNRLSGMLPICASCKMIRDDKGYWNQIEAYIADHSEAEFSHGICPKCARKLYPELYEE